MFGFGGIMMYAVVGLGVALAVVTAGFTWYYKDSQAEIKQLSGAIAAADQQIITLKGAVKSQVDVINNIQGRFKKQIRANKELQERLHGAEAEQDRLAKLLSRHDLRYLSYRKPGLIQKRMNDATEKKRKELENATKD